jgi:hypothetical protein
VRAPEDRGSATVELVTLSVLLLLPIVYVVIAVVQTEAASFATRQAAREAARAFVTGDSLRAADARALTAVRLAFQGQGFDVSPSVSFHTGRTCHGSVPLRVEPGTDITACLTVDLSLPLADRLGGIVHLSAIHTFRVDQHRAVLG